MHWELVKWICRLFLGQLATLSGKIVAQKSEKLTFFAPSLGHKSFCCLLLLMMQKQKVVPASVNHLLLMESYVMIMSNLENVWRWDAYSLPMGVIVGDDFFAVASEKLDSIFWSPSQNLWDKPSACPNHQPSMMQIISSMRTKQKMFDVRDAYSWESVVSEKLDRICWTIYKPKSMRQTTCMSQPSSFIYGYSHPYGWNKQCLMDEMDMMPILCPWESVGAYFLAVVSEKLDRIYCWTPSQNVWDKPSASPNHCTFITI
jgi:hypothetical protein